MQTHIRPLGQYHSHSNRSVAVALDIDRSGANTIALLRACYLLGVVDIVGLLGVILRCAK